MLAPDVAEQLENANGDVSRGILVFLDNDNVALDLKAFMEAIFDRLIVRSTKRPSRDFNPEIVVSAIICLEKNPHLRSATQTRFADKALNLTRLSGIELWL